jgi:hypothetical protein
MRKLVFLAGLLSGLLLPLAPRAASAVVVTPHHYRLHRYPPHHGPFHRYFYRGRWYYRY